METILTPEKAKAARQKTNLSQGKVATDLGINRAYLSLFESGKYIFDQSVLLSLRSYYEQNGYVFESTHGIKSESPSYSRIKDGFAIPEGMDESEVEKLLVAYKGNRNKIALLCQQYPKDSLFWIDEDDVENRKEEVLTLMARNYALIEQLRGHQYITFRNSEAATTKRKRRTIGEYVSDLLT